jgi:pimeloyl-ACP methyl ester carboxylesterase
MLRFFILLFPALVWAAPETKTVVQELSKGRNLLVQYVKPSAGKPSFLFLPGVNRGLLINEPTAQKLIKDGYGVVAFNFSVQPLSIATLGKNVEPAFYAKDIELKDLAEETLALAKALRSEGLDRLIPVSLSYSGAVSRFLGLPAAIDAVPLTSMDAFNPALAQTRRTLLMTEWTLGLMGPANTRYWLDAAYKTAWVPQVKSISEQFELPKERADEMVDGYVRLSRATEGFEWNKGVDRTTRLWILAGNEAPALQRHQVETIVERWKSGREEAVVLVKEAGHVIPADQPAIYAEILEKAEAGQIQPGLTVITPSTGTWTHFTLEKAQEELSRR